MALLCYNRPNELPPVLATRREYGQPVQEVIMSILPQKVCRACGALKPLSDFNKDKTKKSGYRSLCRECDNAKSRTWHEQNHARAAASAKKRHEANRDRDAARARRWYEANRELVIERAREWELANAEKSRRIKQASARRLVMNRRASRQAWKRRNPNVSLVHKHARRARKRANGGAFTLQEWRDLCAHFENRCLCCGRDDVKLTADHIVPLERGGSSFISNIQPLCGRCNSAKGTKIIDYRRAEAEGLTVELVPSS